MALPSDDFEFFDAAFLEELVELATSAAPPAARPPSTDALAGRLSAFVAPIKGEGGPLTEDRFIETTGTALAERANVLLEVCRPPSGSETARAVESFIVFFQALIPTLTEDGARQIKRVFYRLAPSLIQIAFGPKASQDEDAVAALRNLEAILIEIASIRLAPTESALVFRSIDHMAGFIAAADYTLANEVISEQLLGLIRRNRLARSLYRLMEVEVNVQRYLKEKLGYSTPQIRLPGDVPRLADYGPVRILEEDLTGGEGESRRFLQFHIPDVPILRDIVLHLVSQETGRSYDFRLDALGTSPLDVPDGGYIIGLAYEPGP